MPSPADDLQTTFDALVDELDPGSQAGADSIDALRVRVE